MNYLKFVRFLSLPLCSLMLLTFSHEANGQIQTLSNAQANATRTFSKPDSVRLNPTAAGPCVVNPNNIFASTPCLFVGPNTALAFGGKRDVNFNGPFTYDIGNFPSDAILQPVTATSRNGLVTATATSQIQVIKRTPEDDSNSVYYDWALVTEAKIEKNGSSSSGLANSTGLDPVFFAVDDINSGLNTIFEETVTFEPGLSVFTDSGLDTISATTFRDTTLPIDIPETEGIEEQIFDIALVPTTPFVPGEEPGDDIEIPGGIDAQVFINPHPSLTFFENPDLTMEIAADDLAVLLEEEFENPENGIGTPFGLISEISFSYTWDLSGFDISATDTIGGGGESFVQANSVPESSTNVSLLIFGGLGTLLIGKRQLKSNKSVNYLDSLC